MARQSTLKAMTTISARMGVCSASHTPGIYMAYEMQGQED